MVCPLYLALTAAEFQHMPQLPPNAAWMACHFSPYGDGLSNIPNDLPEGSMLMVNDWLPVQGHSPERIAQQLKDTVERLAVSRVLLDLQRAGNKETVAIVERVLETLPCPVSVALPYAQKGFPVLLPPVPTQTALEDHLKPYSGYEIWLEMAPLVTCATVTESGTTFREIEEDWDSPVFFDETLKCHYQTKVEKDSIRFLLRRTKEDVLLLREEAQTLNVSCCVGLYREIK